MSRHTEILDIKERLTAVENLLYGVTKEPKKEPEKSTEHKRR